MKILIVGPLGAGKSTLAYAIQKRFKLPRLNLDEICRNPADGSYYTQKEQFAKLESFRSMYSDWVAEGCQKRLYETLHPDVIVDMRLNRLIAIVRFTYRFVKAKKLIGQKIDKDLPVQAYHYRKITLAKIKDYDIVGQEINADIKDFLNKNMIPVVRCRGYKDYKKVFEIIERINDCCL